MVFQKRIPWGFPSLVGSGFPLQVLASFAPFGRVSNLCPYPIGEMVWLPVRSGASGGCGLSIPIPKPALPKDFCFASKSCPAQTNRPLNRILSVKNLRHSGFGGACTFRQSAQPIQRRHIVSSTEIHLLPKLAQFSACRFSASEPEFLPDPAQYQPSLPGFHFWPGPEKELNPSPHICINQKPGP